MLGNSVDSLIWDFLGAYLEAINASHEGLMDNIWKNYDRNIPYSWDKLFHQI